MHLLKDKGKQRKWADFLNLDIGSWYMCFWYYLDAHILTFHYNFPHFWLERALGKRLGKRIQEKGNEGLQWHNEEQWHDCAPSHSIPEPGSHDLFLWFLLFPYSIISKSAEVPSLKCVPHLATHPFCPHLFIPATLASLLLLIYVKLTPTTGPWQRLH